MKNPEFLTSKGVDLQKSLELFGNIETYNDTVGEFIVGTANKTNKLKEYMAIKDLANYATYVHSLKSDAKYFGFNKLADKAFEHEQKSKEGDITYVYQHFNDLVASVNEAIAIVNEYLRGEPDQPTVIEQPAPAVSETTAPTQESVVEKLEQSYAEPTILVVDDSNIIRNFTRRIFESKYAVGTAKNGQEAIDIIDANKDSDKIVAILLDLNMPKVDGFAVLQYMQDNNMFEKIPVSIISGDSSKETIHNAYKYPIVDMLGKPFNENDVKRVVEKTIMYKELS